MTQTLTGSEFLNGQAEIHSDLADDVQQQLVALPDRPDAANPVAQAAWDAQYQYLKSQRQNLSALATTYAIQDAGAAIQDVADELKDVAKTTQQAQTQIKTIQKISDFVTAIALVIDLGVAVTAAVAGPDAGSLKAVADKVKALGAQLKKLDAAEGGEQ